MQSQIITLPLRFEIEVYSGISTPATLLEAIASSPSQRPISSHPANNPTTQARRHDPAYPPQLAQGRQAADEAPPSYQDATADYITPPPDEPSGGGTGDLYLAD
jgi:hypothetical protein